MSTLRSSTRQHIPLLQLKNQKTALHHTTWVVLLSSCGKQVHLVRFNPSLPHTPQRYLSELNRQLSDFYVLTVIGEQVFIVLPFQIKMMKQLNMLTKLSRPTLSFTFPAWLFLAREIARCWCYLVCLQLQVLPRTTHRYQ